MRLLSYMLLAFVVLHQVVSLSDVSRKCLKTVQGSFLSRLTPNQKELYMFCKFKLLGFVDQSGGMNYDAIIDYMHENRLLKWLAKNEIDNCHEPKGTVEDTVLDVMGCVTRLDETSLKSVVEKL